MNLNDTEFLLNEEPLIKSIDANQDFSTEYLLSHSFEDDSAYQKTASQDSQKSAKAFIAVTNENTENNVAIQDALIIQTHSAINSFLIDYKVAKGHTEADRDLDQNTLKTFLNIFENYCYLIRFYEFQLYVTNRDKYIRLLANFFTINTVENIMYTDDYDMFLEIVKTFVHEPTNIYMRLAKNLLDKSNRLKAQILVTWKNKSEIYTTSALINKKRNIELMNLVLMKICDEFRVTDYELLKREKIILLRILERAFKTWTERKLLNEHFIDFGKELVRERVFKNILVQKRKHLLHNTEKATLKANQAIKRKTLETVRHQENIVKKAEEIQNNFAVKTLKQKYINEIKHAYKSIEYINNKPYVSLKEKALEQMVFNSRLIRQGDARYFDCMKQKCWSSIKKKHILCMLEKRYLSSVKNKNLLLLRQKLHSLTKEKHLSISTQDMLLKKRVLTNWKNEHNFDKASLDTINSNNQLCSTSIKSTLTKWRTMVRNIENEKLLFYERIYREEVAAPVAREFIYRKMLYHYMTLKKNQENAISSHSLSNKKAFFQKSRDTLGAFSSQKSKATTYRKQAVADFNFDRWRLYLNVTSSHDELVTAFLNKKITLDLSRLLYNWNLRIMRNQTMQTPLSTHLKRWKRAQIRGALEIWLEKLKLKEESTAREIKTPFRPYQMHKAFDGTVERGSLSKRLLQNIPLEEKSFVNQNVFSSEYKSSKIKEKKEFLKNLTPSTRFSKELLKPSPVKRNNLRSRIDNKQMSKDHFNSKDYLLSHNGYKDNRFSRNILMSDDSSFNTPMSTSSKISHKNSLKAHNFLSAEEDGGEALPRLK
jgi:hypothetical protein